MTMDPIVDQNRVQESDTSTRSRLAQWSVGIAATATVVIVLFGLIFAVAYAIGGSNAVSDNWVGLLGAVALIGGLSASLLAFVFAIAVRIKSEHWAWLWLPIFLFPGLLAFLVLGEVLWWE